MFIGKDKHLQVDAGGIACYSLNRFTIPYCAAYMGTSMRICLENSLP